MHDDANGADEAAYFVESGSDSNDDSNDDDAAPEYVVDEGSDTE